MIKDLQDITLCVIDRGTFFPVAERLARDVKKVYYCSPNGESFETFATGSRGDGHETVTLVKEWAQVANEVDQFVFPDCNDGWLQTFLEGLGFPVWGSKRADELETMRGRWLAKCAGAGLPIPETHRISGLTNLQLFLDEHEGEVWWVKVSRWRGDMETWKAVDKHQIRNKIAVLRMKWGPMAEGMPLYCQKNLDTQIEGGADTYFVAGDYPDKIILGYEKKGESYFAVVKDRADMPPEIWKPAEIIRPVLAELGYCNMVSSEIRVANGESYWLDPCFRFPSPAGEEQLEIYKNFSRIVVHGAHGELIQPDIDETFCGEAVISYNGDRESWKSFKVPDEVRQWVKLYACVFYDGAYHFNQAHDPEALGCAVALGHSPVEVLDRLKDIAEQMKDAPIDVHIEPIAHLFAEIDEAEKQGIPFSNKKLPEPAEALE